MLAVWTVWWLWTYVRIWIVLGVVWWVSLIDFFWWAMVRRLHFWLNCCVWGKNIGLKIDRWQDCISCFLWCLCLRSSTCVSIGCSLNFTFICVFRARVFCGFGIGWGVCFWIYGGEFGKGVSCWWWVLSLIFGGRNEWRVLIQIVRVIQMLRCAVVGENESAGLKADFTILYSYWQCQTSQLNL